MGRRLNLRARELGRNKRIVPCRKSCAVPIVALHPPLLDLTPGHLAPSHIHVAVVCHSIIHLVTLVEEVFGQRL